MENTVEREVHPPDNTVVPFGQARRAPRLQNLSDAQMDTLIRLLQVAPALMRLASKTDDLEGLLVTADKIISRCPVAAHIAASE